MLDYIQQARDIQMAHVPFKYPIEATEKTLLFCFDGTKRELSLSKSGITALLQLLYEHVDRKKARTLYREGKFQEFAEYINQCRKYQESAELWRKSQTFWLALHASKIYGVMVRYNVKFNTDVLCTIEDQQMMDHITRFTLTPLEMDVFFKHNTTHGLEYGMAIRNGETGHAAYSFNFYVYENQNDYVFTSPNYQRRKHLGKLGLVDDDLQAIFAEIKEIGFDQFILETPAKNFIDLLLADEKYDKLKEVLEKQQSRPLYALLGALHTLHGQRGYKTITQLALDTVYNEIMEYI